MFPTQRLRESRRLRLTIVAALWLFALASVLLMYWAWVGPSYTLRVVVAFAFFAEFSVVGTCFAVLRRLGAGRSVTGPYLLASLFQWEILPGGLLLLPFTLFFPPAAIPILLTIFLAMRARHLIAQDRILAGATTLLLPTAFVVAVCFFRPWAEGSEIWPVVGTIHAVIFFVTLCIVAVSIGTRHQRLSPAH